MASTKTKTTQAPAESAEVPEAADWREDGDRLAALYGLTPKVETAIAAAVAEGADDRARALVAPLHPADQADLLERLPAPRAAARYVSSVTASMPRRSPISAKTRATTSSR